jgi:hypothetical protein
MAISSSQAYSGRGSYTKPLNKALRYWSDMVLTVMSSGAQATKAISIRLQCIPRMVTAPFLGISSAFINYHPWHRLESRPSARVRCRIFKVLRNHSENTMRSKVMRTSLEAMPSCQDVKKPLHLAIRPSPFHTLSYPVRHSKSIFLLSACSRYSP